MNRSVANDPYAGLEYAGLDHHRQWHDSSWRRRVRQRLLRWYDTAARDLPWRENPTAYRVWVSEVMLQQTQVATVIPYYRRFLDSFPSVEALAAADEQALMKHWEGLGYYRRARSMHAAARRIVDEYAGEFPTRFEQVIDLPGIGRYTAGAILSISRDARLPIVEGNTQRVFSRWIALRDPVTSTDSTKLLWSVAEAMLPRKHSGRFNQAAMELGALICTPTQPRCGQCPVASSCAAHALAIEEDLPVKTSSMKYESRTEFALVISDSSKRPTRYLVRKLPTGARWAGLWDFPRPTDRELDSVEAAADLVSDQLGAPVVPHEKLTTIRHGVTKYRISLHVHSARMLAATAAKAAWRPPKSWRFASPSELARLPMSVTGRKIAEMLNAESRPKSRSQPR